MGDVSLALCVPSINMAYLIPSSMHINSCKFMGFIVHICVCLCVCAGNFVVESAFERIVAENQYCDKPMGLLVVRGDNAIFIGEMVISFLS